MNTRETAIQNLLTALRNMNPHGQPPEVGTALYDAIWAAVCHQTSNCAKFYTGDEPDAVLYRAVGEALACNR